MGSKCAFTRIIVLLTTQLMVMLDPAIFYCVMLALRGGDRAHENDRAVVDGTSRRNSAHAS
jgi:hypothetical protein